jgi:hypothetical protein
MQQLERCRKSMPSCAPPSAPGCAGRGRHGRNRNRCVYEGVFGSRHIHEGAVMTRDTIFRVATLLGLAFLGVPLATFSALEGNQIGQSAKS